MICQIYVKGGQNENNAHNWSDFVINMDLKYHFC